MAIEPEPVKGLSTKNSVSSDGMPRKLKTGAVNFVRKLEMPLIAKSSTTEKIATKYAKVLMHRSTAFLAPLTKHSYAFIFFIRLYANTKIMKIGIM